MTMRKSMTFISNIPGVHYFKQYAVFITGGGIGAFVKWLACFVLTSLLGVYYIKALLVAEVINIVINYVWHRYITFKAEGALVRQIIRFVALSCATIAIGMLLVFVVKEFVLDDLGQITIRGMRFNYLVAIAVVTFAVSLINYCFSRIWVFTLDG